MSNESSYTAGTKRAADKPVQVLHSPNSKAGRAMRLRATREQQEMRELDRQLEGRCDGCGLYLEGEITLTPEFGPMHSSCAGRAADPTAPENVGDDGGFLEA